MEENKTGSLPYSLSKINSKEIKISNAKLILKINVFVDPMIPLL